MSEFFGSVLRADATVGRAISSVAGWTPLDLLVSAATALGLYGFVWVLAGAVLAFRFRGSVAEGFVRLLWSVVLATLVVNLVIKPAIGRVRPDASHLTRSWVAAMATSRTTGESFPSGHAAQAAAGAYALGLMWPRRRTWIYAAGVVVALSRVYLGVHYPLDVLAGGVVGLGAGFLATGATRYDADTSAALGDSVPREPGRAGR